MNDDTETTRRDASRKDTVPVNHPLPVLDGLDDDVRDWLDVVQDGDAASTARTIVEVERIRRRNIGAFQFLLSWSSKGSRERLRLLRLLVEHRLGVTYADISDRLDVSDRRARTFVKELRDEDIVETPGRPAQIRFTDDDFRVLAADITAWL